jgi:tight adherence protein C
MDNKISDILMGLIVNIKKLIFIGIRNFRIFNFIITNFPQIPRYCKLIYGPQNSNEHDPFMQWTLNLLLIVILNITLLGTVCLLMHDAIMTLVSSLFILAIPLFMWRDLVSKVKRRQEQILSELPSFMQKVSLLLSAGETVQRAWIRSGATPPHMMNHPLYKELARTNAQLDQLVPFGKALEDLNRRCGVHEISTMITNVLMNYRRGGETFALALHEASRIVIERKRTMIRTNAEEATQKLIFPMILMLGAIMVIVSAPAIILMSGY